MQHSWASSWRRYFSNRGYGIRHTSARDRIVGTVLTVGTLGSMAGAAVLIGWLLGR